MSNLLVKMELGPDGKLICALGVNIQMTGTFRAGIVEALGHRKMSKKFIEGVCKALVKQIQPQLLEAIKKEHHFYEHPEDIPVAPEGLAVPIHPALLAHDTPEVDDSNGEGDGDVGEGSGGDTGVPESDQEPDLRH